MFMGEPQLKLEQLLVSRQPVAAEERPTMVFKAPDGVDYRVAHQTTTDREIWRVVLAVKDKVDHGGVQYYRAVTQSEVSNLLWENQI
jgi:hypothetical protein